MIFIVLLRIVNVFTSVMEDFGVVNVHSEPWEDSDLWVYPKVAFHVLVPFHHSGGKFRILFYHVLMSICSVFSAFPKEGCGPIFLG